MGLILNKADLGKKVFLVPPAPFMNYTWQEAIALPKGALWLLLLALALPIGLLGVGAYEAFLGFILDPQHHLRYGSFGLIPGVILSVIVVKLLVNWLKLLAYLFGFTKISK